MTWYDRIHLDNQHNHSSVGSRDLVTLREQRDGVGVVVVEVVREEDVAVRVRGHEHLPHRLDERLRDRERLLVQDRARVLRDRDLLRSNGMLKTPWLHKRATHQRVSKHQNTNDALP